MSIDIRSEHRMIRHAVTREGRVAHMRSAMRKNINSRNALQAGRSRYRIFGKLMAALMRYHDKDMYSDARRIIRIINDMRTYAVPFTPGRNCSCRWTVLEELSSRGYHVCNGCGEVLIDERDTACDSGYDQHDALICSDCIEYTHLWSEYMDCYIRERHAVRVQDVRRVCYATYEYLCDNSPNDFVTDSYGDWYTRAEAERCGIDLGDGDDEDEREPSSDGLSRYHGSRDRTFAEYSKDGSLPLGLELEVWAGDRRETVKYLRDYYNYGSQRLLLEEDGSLSDNYGMEIITQPLGRAEWMQMAPPLLTYLRTHGVRGYSHPDSSTYGIHISVNRDKLAPLQEARLLRFLVDEHNGDFVRVIGQRYKIYGAYEDSKYAIGGCSKDTKLKNINSQCLVRREYGRANTRLSCSDVRYAALNFKSLSGGTQVVEFRIFYSTLKTSSFLKNLEFVWALCAWTSPKASTGTTVDHRDFVSWLFANKTRRLEYPNLCSYLLRETYRVKGSRQAITNTWKDVIKVTPRQVLAIHKHAA